MGSCYSGMMNNKDGYGELRHHGILGQKWGVKNGPPYPISSEHTNISTPKDLKNAKTFNLDKWGIDAEHNVLYITGYSGSGKSTVAEKLSKPGDTIIHLDSYTENNNRVKKNQSRKFNSYLDKNVPEWKSISKQDFNSKTYWNTVDDFLNAINSYAIKEFSDGHRVIAEGVQISDDWFGKDNQAKLKNKPVVILGTNAVTSLKRARVRDNESEHNALLEFVRNNNLRDYVRIINSYKSKRNDMKKLESILGD
jgi:uridine kinase